MPFKHISVADTQSLLAEKPEAVVVDIRDPMSFEQGRIPKAQALSNDNVQAFVEATDKQVPVLVCCYHGNSSQQAADFLNAQGFDDVYSIDGGFEVWKTQGEVERG